jgi:hypothetical protein
MHSIGRALSRSTQRSRRKNVNENEIAEKIIGLAIKVHSVLGPGLLESAYEKDLAFELRRNGFYIRDSETDSHPL